MSHKLLFTVCMRYLNEENRIWQWLCCAFLGKFHGASKEIKRKLAVNTFLTRRIDLYSYVSIS